MLKPLRGSDLLEDLNSMYEAAGEEDEAHVPSWKKHPIIAPCTCKDAVRDNVYGKGTREHEKAPNGMMKCLSCSQVKKRPEMEEARSVRHRLAESGSAFCQGLDSKFATIMRDESFQRLVIEEAADYSEDMTEDDVLERAFNEIYPRWMEDLEARGRFEGNAVVCYRGVSLKKPEDLNTRSLGIFWTWDKAKAANYSGKNTSAPLYILEAPIPMEAIDLKDTLKKIVWPGYEFDESEREITLLESAKVKIKSFTKDGKPLPLPSMESKLNEADGNPLPPKSSPWYKLAAKLDMGIVDLDTVAEEMGCENYEELETSYTPKSAFQRVGRNLILALRKASMMAQKFDDADIAKMVGVSPALATENASTWKRFGFSQIMLDEDKLTTSEALKVLGLQATDLGNADVIKKAYRKAAMDAHPDRGGSEELMKQVNAAYELLQNAKGGASKSGVDWDAIDTKYRELAKKAVAFLKDKFDFKVFLDYFKKYDPGFESKVDYFPEESSTLRPDQAGFDAVFKTPDGKRRFALHFSINLVEMLKASSGLGGEGDMYRYFASTSAYVDGKNLKLTQARYTLSSKEAALLDPEVLFPPAKMKKFFSGEARKDSKFSKRDMYAALESELGAKLSGEYVYIPLEDDMNLVLMRSVMMRVPVWTTVGVYAGKYMSKRLSSLTASLYETYETVEKLKSAVEIFKSTEGDAKAKIDALTVFIKNKEV